MELSSIVKVYEFLDDPDSMGTLTSNVTVTEIFLPRIGMAKLTDPPLVNVSPSNASKELFLETVNSIPRFPRTPE